MRLRRGRHRLRLGLVCGALLAACVVPGRADPPAPAGALPGRGPVDRPLATEQKEPAPPPATDEAAVRAAMERGVAFLLGSQRRDGSWGAPTRTKGLNIYAPVPGAHHAFRSAVTALCVSALYELPPGEWAGVDAARAEAEAFLLRELPRVRRADPTAIYNVWTHAYGLQALVRMHQATQDPARQEEIRRAAASQIELLGRYESVNGGWGYYDFDVGSKRPASSAISFTTATVLIAFHEVKALPGVEVPEPLVRRAIDSINRQKKPDHSYLYGEYLKWQPVRGINNAGGSLGRSQACNLALRLWGDEGITDALVEEWLHRLRDRNGWLDMGRKRPIPHESWMQVAAYFYYYGHYYASQCVELLPAGRRPAFQRDLAGLILPLQEKDGSWWDFPFYDYHQPYGTAFALMTLRRCLPEAEEVAGRTADNARTLQGRW